MKLPSKFSEQLVRNTSTKIEEHILIVMIKSTHKEILSQPLQTKTKQVKLFVTFLIGYKSFLNATDKNINFFLVSVCEDDE